MVLNLSKFTKYPNIHLSLVSLILDALLVLSSICRFLRSYIESNASLSDFSFLEPRYIQPRAAPIALRTRPSPFFYLSSSKVSSASYSVYDVLFGDTAAKLAVHLAKSVHVLTERALARRCVHLLSSITVTGWGRGAKPRFEQPKTTQSSFHRIFFSFA